jgi:DNA modification methylase
MQKNKIYLGNNIDVLRTFPNNSIDSVVTDPPYGISFMNKKWDYDVPTVELWQEVYRVLKPGGHILVACGTRTQHRMTTNIEDAGFEIRDIVAWVYGSGFPKSHDVSKAIDKMMGAEREIIGKAKGVGTNNTNSMKNGLGKSQEFQSEYDITTPTTDQAKQWEGWGSALKPAMELFTLARKPLNGTIAENVLQWGTGGLNIDGCRVEYGNEKDNRVGTDFVSNGGDASNNQNDNQVPNKHYVQMYKDNGRFPANFIHDGSEEVSALMGEAARYFYTPKASQSERNKGLNAFEEKNTSSAEFRPNHLEKAEQGENGNPYGRWKKQKNIHPTVKPLDLMQYLCRLITKRGGIVLDPFVGSGTTAIAAKLERMDYIGIEIDLEYQKIAEARIKDYFVQYDIFDFMEDA